MEAFLCNWSSAELQLFLIGSSRESAPEILWVFFFFPGLSYLFSSFLLILLIYFSPRLTVIVVKKRVSTRFFAQAGGGLKNPPPGTVVDIEVTRPEW